MTKTCIIIAGPTAVGKTALAIELAQHFSTQIISADSRQCFRELTIGVAKPSLAELSLVHHYFIDTHSIQERVSAADFEAYALHSLEEIFKTNNIAVMVGGTGLYIKAFTEGLDDIPAIDPLIKESIRRNYEEGGLNWLQQEIKDKDPVYSSKGEIMNPQRMMRALEVVIATGASITEFQGKQKKSRNFNIIKFGLELARTVLYDRINKRVDSMMYEGLLAEAEGLLPHKTLNALQTVGYRELFEYFEGRISLQQAVELIKQHTRHYAKRQMTWFKRDEAMDWLDMSSPSQTLNTLISRINEKTNAG